MINRAVIVGRLTRDPDLRYTPSGVAVSNFTLACNRPFKNQQGEQEADFIQCVAWRKQAENIANYMKKGSLVGIDGRIQTRTFEDKDGKTIYVTEVLAENIQFLESRSNNQSNSNNTKSYQQNNQQYQQAQPQQAQQTQQQSNPFEQNGQEVNISDDELPF